MSKQDRTRIRYFDIVAQMLAGGCPFDNIAEALKREYENRIKNNISYTVKSAHASDEVVTNNR